LRVSRQGNAGGVELPLSEDKKCKYPRDNFVQYFYTVGGSDLPLS
jgi:hypothetical protein